MADVEIVEVTICTDCALWAANRDDSGSDPDQWWPELFDVGMARQGFESLSVGDDYGFSKYPCQICDNGLAGDRLEAYGLHRIED